MHLFEREIAEQFGLRPDGHPWLKPVRFHRSYRPGHDAWGRPTASARRSASPTSTASRATRSTRSPSGPVHAGIIEPGHFRFQCHGEHVFHLEISLGYQHRGVERALVGGPDTRTIHYAETLAGDTTIGHATAYCQAVEALAGVPEARRARRRCAASRSSSSAWPTTPATSARWPATSASCRPLRYCGRLRGDFLNMTALLCGSRFGRGLVRPGGVGFDVDDARSSATC